MPLIRVDNQTGGLAAPLASSVGIGGTFTLTLPWPGSTVASPNAVRMVIDPPTLGVPNGSYEVLYVTLTNGSPTVTVVARGAEGTTAQTHMALAFWGVNNTAEDYTAASMGWINAFDGTGITGNGVTDDGPAWRAFTSSISTNGYVTIGIPAGSQSLIASASSGVGIDFTSIPNLTIIGDGARIIFSGTFTDGIRLQGCEWPMLQRVQLECALGAVVTHAIQDTVAPGGSRTGATYYSVKINSSNLTSRLVYDGFLRAGSPVVTSVKAAFAAGDVGAPIAIDTELDIVTDVIQSVATLTGTLASALTDTVGTTVSLTGAISGAPTGSYPILIDTEEMLVTAGGQTSTLTVVRGYNFTTAATHLISAVPTTYQATIANNSVYTWGPGFVKIGTPTSGYFLNGFCVGSDSPGSSNLDVSNTHFFGCDAQAIMGADYRVGNGTYGNVLNCDFIGCNASGAGVGVMGAATGYNWVGAASGNNGVDFKADLAEQDSAVSIQGARSEHSALLFEGYSSTQQAQVSIRDSVTTGSSAPDGIPIRMIGSATVELDNVFLNGGFSNTRNMSIAVASQVAANPANLTMNNVSTNTAADPIPAASSLVSRQRRGGFLASGATWTAFTTVDDTIGAGGIVWPLTYTGDQDFQPNGIVNTVLDLHNNSGSAINGVLISGTSSGVAPIISPISQTDTNESLQLSPLGTGGVQILGGAATSPGLAFLVAGVSSAVNYLHVANAATTAAPALGAVGSDTNINLALTPKGTGLVDVNLAGSGFAVKEGSNCKQGTATLSSGTVVVSNTAVTASSRIFLTVQSLGTVTAPSALCVSARSAGTSFTILASQLTDTSVIAYEIFEPG
jgi:hypothetical protein